MYSSWSLCVVCRSPRAAQETGTTEDVHTSNQGWSFQASQGQTSSPSSSLQMTTWGPSGEVINGNESSPSVLVSCPSSGHRSLLRFFPWFWLLLFLVCDSFHPHHWCHVISIITFTHLFASCHGRCSSYLSLLPCLYASWWLWLMKETAVALPESHLLITVHALCISVLPANKCAVLKCVHPVCVRWCVCAFINIPLEFMNRRKL